MENIKIPAGPELITGHAGNQFLSGKVILTQGFYKSNMTFSAFT